MLFYNKGPRSIKSLQSELCRILIGLCLRYKIRVIPLKTVFDLWYTGAYIGIHCMIFENVIKKNNVYPRCFLCQTGWVINSNLSWFNFAKYLHLTLCMYKNSDALIKLNSGSGGKIRQNVTKINSFQIHMFCQNASVTCV